MQFRKILVPTDFSDGSEAALALASSLARDSHARLVIVHVHEREMVYTGFASAYAALPEEQRSDSRQLLDQVTPPIPGVDFERRLIDGLPAQAIVELATTEDGIDLIVLGTHGRTGLSRLVMGSVAEEVVRNAPCPVLTIKEPKNEAAAASN